MFSQVKFSLVCLIGFFYIFHSKAIFCDSSIRHSLWFPQFFSSKHEIQWALERIVEIQVFLAVGGQETAWIVFKWLHAIPCHSFIYLKKKICNWHSASKRVLWTMLKNLPLCCRSNDYSVFMPHISFFLLTMDKKELLDPESNQNKKIESFLHLQLFHSFNLSSISN